MGKGGGINITLKGTQGIWIINSYRECYLVKGSHWLGRESYILGEVEDSHSINVTGIQNKPCTALDAWFYICREEKSHSWVCALWIQTKNLPKSQQTPQQTIRNTFPIFLLHLPQFSFIQSDQNCLMTENRIVIFFILKKPTSRNPNEVQHGAKLVYKFSP